MRDWPGLVRLVLVVSVPVVTRPSAEQTTKEAAEAGHLATAQGGPRLRRRLGRWGVRVEGGLGLGLREGWGREGSLVWSEFGPCDPGCACADRRPPRSIIPPANGPRRSPPVLSPRRQRPVTERGPSGQAQLNRKSQEGSMGLQRGRCLQRTLTPLHTCDLHARTALATSYSSWRRPPLGGRRGRDARRHRLLRRSEWRRALLRAPGPGSSCKPRSGGSASGE